MKHKHSFFPFLKKKNKKQNRAVTENIHTSPTEEIGGGVGGSVRPKNLKKCMKLNQNFQRGRYDIFWSYTLSIA